MFASAWWGICFEKKSLTVINKVGNRTRFVRTVDLDLGSSNIKKTRKNLNMWEPKKDDSVTLLALKIMTININCQRCVL